MKGANLPPPHCIMQMILILLLSLMIKYAATNLNPMQRIIVDSTTMEIVSGDKVLHTDKYLVD